jgi:membrane-bound ClpP family serine protease
MNKKFMLTRLVLAVISNVFQEVAIWVIWRWLLPEFGINLPVPWLVGVMAVWAAFSTWLFIFTTSTLKKQATAGLPSMVGTRGKASTALAPEGMVMIKGELWGAVSAGGDIPAGEKVVVVGEDGLKLSVRRAGDKPATR